MNKFTEDECQPNFELKFKFLKKLEETTHTQKQKKTDGRKKQNGRDEGRKPNDSSCRGKLNKPREGKSNGYQCREKSSIYCGKKKDEEKRFEAKRSWQ